MDGSQKCGVEESWFCVALAFSTPVSSNIPKLCKLRSIWDSVFPLGVSPVMDCQPLQGVFPEIGRYAPAGSVTTLGMKQVSMDGWVEKHHIFSVNALLKLEFEYEFE